MCGADAGCFAINYQSLSTQLLGGGMHDGHVGIVKWRVTMQFISQGLASIPGQQQLRNLLANEIKGMSKR
jgi:hypothetical protein